MPPLISDAALLVQIYIGRTSHLIRYRGILNCNTMENAKVTGWKWADPMERVIVLALTKEIAMRDTRALRENQRDESHSILNSFGYTSFFARSRRQKTRYMISQKLTLLMYLNVL